ncbi:MAG: DUF2723 domain-containing protein [Deltaproteobacteria bacterium]|nr:DUF2723 domain-containing protein [Deltaproteobacteria bacterium]
MADQHTGQHDRYSQAALWMMWAGVLCSGLLLYGWTVQHGVVWQDSGARQLRILTADYTGSLGLALAHPLYIAIGRLCLLIPYGCDFTRLNFCSGVGMAIALANVSILGCMLTGRRWIGLMTAGMLAVMHTPWWLSTIAEVYTWNMAFFTAELIVFIACIRKPSARRLAGLFFLNGLNLSIHNLALLSLPVYGVFALIVVCRRQVSCVSLVIAAAIYLCGAAPLLTLVLREMQQTGSLRFAVESMLFGRYAGDVLNVGFNWPLMGVNAALSSLNFAHAGLLLGIVGLARMRRMVGKPITWSLLSLMGLYGVFFLRYSVPDQFMFILPSLMLFSLGMAVGIDVLSLRSAVWRNAVVAACLFSIVLMPLTYAVLPFALKKMNISVNRDRVLPFRDEMRYWIVPWKHTEKSAERFAYAALNEAAPEGIIVCDSTSYYPLILRQMRMPGIDDVIVETRSAMSARYGRDPAALRQTLQVRPVFIVSPVLNFISDEFRQDFAVIKEPGLILYRLEALDSKTAW